MTFRLEVDIKALYKKLCPKCQELLVNMVTTSPSKDMIRAALEGPKTEAPGPNPGVKSKGKKKVKK